MEALVEVCEFLDIAHLDGVRTAWIGALYGLVAVILTIKWVIRSVDVAEYERRLKYLSFWLFVIVFLN